MAKADTKPNPMSEATMAVSIKRLEFTTTLVGSQRMHSGTAFVEVNGLYGPMEIAMPFGNVPSLDEAYTLVYRQVAEWAR